MQESNHQDAAQAYTRAALAAITRAARGEHDFAGWLAHVLAAAAGQLGGSDELIIGRPGSWEAELVDRLVKGTIGHADEYLPGPAGGAEAHRRQGPGNPGPARLERDDAA